MVGTLLFFVSNLCALVIAARVALAVSSPARPWSLLTALLGAYVLVAAGVTLSLGVVGLLRPLPALVVLLVLGAPSALWLRRWMAEAGRRPIVDGHRLLGGLRAAPAGLVGASVALVLFWVANAIGAGIYLSVDDRVYHAANAAQWIVSGRIGLTPFTYQSYFPLNAEVLCAWFMLPLGNDAVVGLTGLVYAALFVVATTGMLRRMGVSLASSLMAPVVVLSSTFIIDYCATFSDVDFGGPAVLMASISLVGARRLRQGLLLRWLLAGGLAGFAAGMKVPFALVAVVVMVVTAAAAARESGRRAGVRALALFGVAMVAFGGYFYLRNLLETGTPLYPAQLGPLPGPFLASEQGQTSLAGLLSSPGGTSHLRGLLRQVFDWPASHAVLLGAGVIASIVLVVRRRVSGHAYARAARTMLLVSMGVAVVVFPFQPFSGVNELSQVELNSRRYLIFPFVAGAALMAETLDLALTALRPSGRKRALSLLAVLLLVPMLLRASLAVSVGMTVAGVAGVALARAGWLSRLADGASLLTGRRALALALLGPLLLVSSLAQLTLSRTDRRVLADPLARSLESLPSGSSVARFDTRDGYVLRSSYPLFGRRLQLRPVAVLADGSAAPLLHRRSRTGDSSSFWRFAAGDGPASVEPDELVDHLRQAGVEFVVTAPDPFTGRWPPQHSLLEQSTGAVPLLEGPDGAIFGLRDTRREVAVFRTAPR